MTSTLHLSWQAAEGLRTDGLGFMVRGIGPDGALLWEQVAQPATNVPESWQAGQVVRLAHADEPRFRDRA